VRLLLAAIALCLPSAALAHPSRGIVAAADGRVYFSDLLRIWTISPDGRLSVVRGPNGGHTHELFLASGGTLYGEDSHYDDGRYTSALWRRDDRGGIAFLFGPAPNPPPGLGVVRDQRGCTYQADTTRTGAAVLYRRCGLRAERLAGAIAPRRDLLSNISGAAIGPGGFYFRRGSTVQRVDPASRVAVVASGLSKENFGLAVAPDGSMYAAEFANGRVVRVARDGRRSVAATSPAPWAPTGVAYAGHSLYLLEASRAESSRMRVRRIHGGRSRVMAVVP
jgi:hypothetical protein